MQDMCKRMRNGPQLSIGYLPQPQTRCRRPFHLVDEVMWVVIFIEVQPNVDSAKYRETRSESSDGGLRPLKQLEGFVDKEKELLRPFQAIDVISSVGVNQR